MEFEIRTIHQLDDGLVQYLDPHLTSFCCIVWDDRIHISNGFWISNGLQNGIHFVLNHLKFEQNDGHYVQILNGTVLEWSQSGAMAMPCHSKTKPLEIQTSKCLDFQWVWIFSIQNSSHHQTPAIILFQIKNDNLSTKNR